ncbi:hypothetical protein BS47DRAFT_1400483 [Hydnum rufescens UP504]|uniref:Uncharacterized protein n=1 Tax=Hydnum rufescens UP504 TaxID=1448309 RepID=A0A9P6AGI6_9AGAM|nr:hypothetical protein BS47DRAFT_1400483 [Hydnum rufescens UP504]
MVRAKVAANVERLTKKKAATVAAKKLRAEDLAQWAIDCAAWQVMKDGWVKGQGGRCPAKPKQPKARKPILDISEGRGIEASEQFDSGQIEMQEQGDGGDEDDDGHGHSEEEHMEGDEQSDGD